MLQSIGEQQPLIGMELAELRGILGSHQPAYRAHQLFDALYRKQVANLSEASSLPLKLRTELLERSPLGLPISDKRFDSADGTRRYLLRLQDNRTVEAVLMPEEDRNTICISSQVGCPVDCKFCLTALMGLERNLTAGEIVGQVLHVTRQNSLQASNGRLNVVLMGMGEPLLNLENVLKATRLLVEPTGINISPKHITLSTSGIIPNIELLGRSAIRPKLAISLNASTEEQRQRLMPITRKYHLSELLKACKEYPLRPWERLTFEYVLLKGINDSDADAHRVVRLLAHLKCMVNLIALNPGPGIAFEGSEPERVAGFRAVLQRSLPCFVRKPRGRDIYAACGQLKRAAPELVPLS